MRRNVSLSEISDGRLYGENDMVRADCHDCKGCSDCCRGMGSSIILDPYDVYRLTIGLGKSLPELLEKEVELNVVDGCILPNLRMVGEQEKCTFLTEEGRCGIHALRPGICRLFPLGRYYGEVFETDRVGQAGNTREIVGGTVGETAGETGLVEGADSFQYFLQTSECPAPRTKIKVSKWIDTPNLRRNREFIICWHNLLKRVEGLVQENLDQVDNFQKNLNMFLLKTFYLAPYDGGRDFYEQFEERLERFREVVAE